MKDTMIMDTMKMLTIIIYTMIMDTMMVKTVVVDTMMTMVINTMLPLTCPSSPTLISKLLAFPKTLPLQEVVSQLILHLLIRVLAGQVRSVLAGA